MKILMKDGTIIDLKADDRKKAWISIDTKNRLIEIKNMDGLCNRMVIMMDNADLIDYENEEKTGIAIQVFPGMK